MVEPDLGKSVAPGPKLRDSPLAEYKECLALYQERSEMGYRSKTALLNERILQTISGF